MWMLVLGTATAIAIGLAVWMIADEISQRG